MSWYYYYLLIDLVNEGADDSYEEIEVNSEQTLEDYLDGATQKRFVRHVFFVSSSLQVVLHCIY